MAMFPTGLNLHTGTHLALQHPHAHRTSQDHHGSTALVRRSKHTASSSPSTPQSNAAGTPLARLRNHRQGIQYQAPRQDPQLLVLSQQQRAVPEGDVGTIDEKGAAGRGVAGVRGSY
ncbi:hypothetical protein Vafri_20005 [Volvox africanus]|nr:hypothetical protein Vafri_20005 [Volvox africanus]